VYNIVIKDKHDTDIEIYKIIFIKMSTKVDKLSYCYPRKSISASVTKQVWNEISSGNLKNQAVLDITGLKTITHAAEEIHMILRQNVLYRLRNAENVNFLSNNKK